MDNAVALVQAYLRVNGYLTVSEYPILEASGGGGYRNVTDLDILGFRFAGGGMAPSETVRPTIGTDRMSIDPILKVAVDRPDMLIGEVKEGAAELNRAATRPEVIAAVLERFGCCSGNEVDDAVRTLREYGSAELSIGHRVRLVAFGTTWDGSEPKPYLQIGLHAVVEFLTDYLREHWDVLRHSQLKDPAFGFLATLEKASNRPRRP